MEVVGAVDLSGRRYPSIPEPSLGLGLGRGLFLRSIEHGQSHILVHGRNIDACKAVDLAQAADLPARVMVGNHYVNEQFRWR